jgi:zinc transport system substrate-binding protein
LVALVGFAVLMSSNACSSTNRPTDGRLQVAAAFYPLQWLAEQVGGEQVDVTSLTKPGAEPHDLELTPKEVGSVIDADVVVYLSGFQPAVDEAVSQAHRSAAFDARAAARLDLTYTPVENGKAKADEAGSSDPHFWLDPTRLAKVADALARKLAERDPVHAAEYRRNTRSVVATLGALDLQFARALGTCTSKNLVTSHNAFGYLARRYDLHQVSITGLTPDQEPSPGDLAQTARYVQDHQVKTIYVETLASPATAEAVARETGARTDVLDPIEGLNDASRGRDYLAVMRSNLATLVRDQPCP